MERRLYCIASGRDHQWEAFCLDFDLAVQGQSYEEVRHSLHRAILHYVHEAIEQPEPARTALLKRRAPIRTCFMLVAAILGAMIGSLITFHCYLAKK